jgi:ElaB/YqjD/DUF883 family membrane-anchored ribosome-binding protein
MDNQNPTQSATEKFEAAKAVAATKLESLKTEASVHLTAIGNHLDELKDLVVSKAKETANETDVEGLKASAAAQFEAAKVQATETFATLQTQAEEAVASASAKLDAFTDEADDKLDDLKAEAAEQLEAAEKKLGELQTQAAEQAEILKTKAQGIWNGLFGK